jgi:hypothetical protein
MRYIIDYLCNRDGEDVEEVNGKLSTFIANLNKRVLRPVIPLPNTNYLTSITHLKEDGTVENVTTQSNSIEEFEQSLKAYISSLNSDVTSISKKKVFDDLKVKDGRTQKLPLLKQLLGILRPEIRLLNKS